VRAVESLESERQPQEASSFGRLGFANAPRRAGERKVGSAICREVCVRGAETR
jgi:hypothetical protein